MNKRDKRKEQLKEMILKYDELNEYERGHLLGTVSTIFALHTRDGLSDNQLILN